MNLVYKLLVSLILKKNNLFNFKKHPTLFFDLKFEEGKNKMGILNLFVKNAMNLVPLKENQKLDTFVDA